MPCAEHVLLPEDPVAVRADPSGLGVLGDSRCDGSHLVQQSGTEPLQSMRLGTKDAQIN